MRTLVLWGFLFTQTQAAFVPPDDLALATQLALRSESVRMENPASLEVSALLAAESLVRAPTPDGEHALRAALELLRSPVQTISYDEAINAVAISNDGRFVATVRNQHSQVAWVSTKGERANLNNESGVPYISFDRDGNLFASASGPTVNLFNLEEKENRALDPLPAGGDVISLSLNGAPHGLLAVANAHHVATVFNPYAPQKPAIFRREHARWVALDRNAELLATLEGNVLHVIRIASQRDVFTVTDERGVHMAAFNPVRPLIAVATANGARLFDTDSGRPFGPTLQEGSSIDRLVFSRNGSRLAFAGEDGVVHVFQVVDACKELARLPAQPAIASLAFAGGGKAIVLGIPGRAARVFAADSGLEIARLISSEPITSISASDQASAPIAIGSGKLLQIFGINRLGTHPIPELPDVNYVAFNSANTGVASYYAACKDDTQHTPDARSPGGETTTSECYEEKILVFKTEGGQKVSDRLGHLPVMQLAYSADEHFLAIAERDGSNESIKLFDGEKEYPIVQLIDIDKNPVAQIAFSPDNHPLLAIAGTSTQYHGQDQAYVDTFAPATFPLRSERAGTCPGTAVSVAASPDHQFTALGTSKGACIFRPYPLEPLTPVPPTLRGMAASFSPDSKRVALSTDDGAVHVLDVRSGDEIFTSTKGKPATQLSFDEDSATLAALSADTLRVFNVDGKVEINRFPAAGVRALTFTHRQLTTLKVEGDGPILETHPLRSGDLVDSACSIVGRPLSWDEWKEYVGYQDHPRACQGSPTPFWHRYWLSLVVTVAITLIVVGTWWLRRRHALPPTVPKSHFVKSEQHKKVIIFVHGVLGDMDNTWVNAATNTSWPKLIASDKDLEDYDVYVYGYETRFKARASDISQIANSLGQQLDDEFFAKYDQIFFITHSMGGLITKRMLTTFNTEQKMAKLQKVRAVIFIAVPSRGAPVAALASWLSRNPQFKDMDPEDASGFLQQTEQLLENLIRARNEERPFPRYFVAYETKDFKGIRIVSALYAYTHSDLTEMAFDYDHKNIVKPDSVENNVYRWTRARIRESSEYGGIPSGGDSAATPSQPRPDST